MTFNSLDLNEDLQSAIRDLGFETPTPIQQEAIPFLLQHQDQDLIALAQTGTGKTAAFSLPMLEQIDVNNRNVQALILCPTRELCLQIEREISAYAKHMRGFNAVAVYGGVNASNQKRDLRKGAQLVVGTPGRTLDLIKQKALDVRYIQWLVLDEADEMLSMGFQDDLEAILESTPKEKQNLFFSATMPQGMQGMVKRFMKDPHRIQVAKQNIGATNVEHIYYVTPAKNRYKALQRLVDANPEIYGIIFCRTRRETNEVAQKLIQMGYNADTINGDLSQQQRDHVMQMFKKRSIQLLVATDVAARGIDVQDLTHVINYQLPDDPEVYVHRSGRTGRAGKKGKSLIIVHSREVGKLRRIEKMLGKQIEQKQIPSGDDICRVQIHHFLKAIREHQPDRNLIEQYRDLIDEELYDLDAETVINRLLSLEINRFLKQYEHAPDLNAPNRSKERRGRHDDIDDGRPERDNPKAWAGFELSAGSKHRMNPKRILALINEQTDRSDIAVGKIEVNRKTSYFEVDASEAETIEMAFNDMAFEGKPFISRAKRPAAKSSNKRYEKKRGGRNYKKKSHRKGGGKRRY